MAMYSPTELHATAEGLIATLSIPTIINWDPPLVANDTFSGSNQFNKCATTAKLWRVSSGNPTSKLHDLV